MQLKLVDLMKIPGFTVAKRGNKIVSVEYQRHGFSRGPSLKILVGDPLTDEEFWANNWEVISEE